MTPPQSGSDSVLKALASLVLVAGGLWLAKGVLVPLALALLGVITVLPMVGFLRRFNLPRWLSLLLVIGALMGLGYGAMSVTLSSLQEIRAALPGYAAQVSHAEERLEGALEARGLSGMASVRISHLDVDTVAERVSGILRGAADLAGLALLVFLLAAFMLVEGYHLPTKLNAVASMTGRRTHHFGRVIRQVQRYLVIRSATSAGTGILVGLFAWAIGLDFPILLGVLAFALNYIPTVGSIIAALPAIALALLTLSPGAAVAVALFYAAINLLIGNVVEPAVLGRELGLSPFAVVVSLVVWGTLWGPVGAFLAVPLTMSLRIILEESEEYRWIPILLGRVKDIPATEAPVQSDGAA